MSDLAQHLKSRHVDFKLHRPMIDEFEGVASFFLYNLSGQIVGYQQYRPNANKGNRKNTNETRYFTIYNNSIAVFGVESLHLTPHVVFLTEGIFDAMRLTKFGVSALAVLCNNPKHDVKNFLMCIPQKVIAVCDNDNAGSKLSKFGDISVFTSDKDLGESNDEYVLNLIHQYV